MDVRVINTLNTIRQTFLEMLKEEEIGRITVKALCEKCDINRATFYRYYKDTYDLLKQIEDDLFLSIKEKITEVDLKKLFNTIIQEFSDKRDIYRVICSEKCDPYFAQKIIINCYTEMNTHHKKNLELINEKYQKFFYAFVANGCYGVIRSWFRGGMEESIDEISYILLRIGTQLDVLAKNL